MNPNIALAVAAERMADMRSQAERYRAGRRALAMRRASERRLAAGRDHTDAATAMQADEASLQSPAEISEAQELCLTGARPE